MHKISVIIPIYNADNFLKDCLDSIINQTLQDIEIICINDGSTDKSLEILNKYAAKDSRFVIISQKNKGQGTARNKGIDIAKGEYILFIDPDDFFTKNDAFEKLYLCAIQNNAKIVQFNYQIIHENSEQIIPFNFAKHLKELYSYDLYKVKYYSWKNFSKGWMSKCDTHAWLKMYSSEFLKKNNIYYSPGKFGEDHYFVIQTLIYADKIYYVDESFYCYRDRSNSSCHKKTLDALNFFDYLIHIEDFLKQNNVFTDLEEEFTDYRKNVIRTIFDHMPPNSTYKFKMKLYGYLRDKNEYKKICKMFGLCKFIEDIFSVKNEYSDNVKHKVITVFGIKIKLKIKN